jgi:hypothetical protein
VRGVMSGMRGMGGGGGGDGVRSKERKVRESQRRDASKGEDRQGEKRYSQRTCTSYHCIYIDQFKFAKLGKWTRTRRPRKVCDQCRVRNLHFSYAQYLFTPRLSTARTHVIANMFKSEFRVVFD